MPIISMETAGLKVSVEEGWVSCSSGEKTIAPVVKYLKRAKLPIVFVSSIYVIGKFC